MKKILIIVLMLFVFTGYVNAEDVYINNKGVEIPIEKYEYLSQFYPKTGIDLLTQEKYDAIKDKEFVLISKEEKFYKTISTYDRFGNIRLSATEEVDENTYKENDVIPYSTCDPIDADVCWETNMKKIRFYASCDKNALTNCGMALDVEWKSLPSTKSYDVLAFRWENVNFTPKTYLANVGGHKNGLLDSEEYDDDYSIVTQASNGFGMSIKLPTGYSDLRVYGQVQGTFSKSAYTMYGSYQHAQSSLSLADSKSYTFSNAGLGNVIYYSNSSIRNKYDNTSGLRFTNQ